MPKPVFISFRVKEALAEARILAAMLRSVGIECFLSQDDLQKGDDWREEIANALDACLLMVVLGTGDYGGKGTATQGTWEELLFAKEDNKLLYVIKMCDKFAVPKARMELSKLQSVTVSEG